MNFYWRNEWTLPSVVGAVSFGIGAATGVAVGYTISRRRIEEAYSQQLLEIIDTFEADVNQLRFNFENETNKVTEFFDEAKEKIQLLEPIEEPVELEPISLEDHSIFITETPEWDYEKEIPNRNPNTPYIIHKDEFINNESGYNQSTLTYYQGDDVLLDEQDIPLYDAKRIVCDLEFGKGSEDPNIVYIRNDRLEAEYEILLEHGHYAVEVLGAEMEGSFVDKPNLQKFRNNRD